MMKLDSAYELDEKEIRLALIQYVVRERGLSYNDVADANIQSYDDGHTHRAFVRMRIEEFK